MRGLRRGEAGNMRKAQNLFRIILLAAALLAVFTLTACKREPADSGTVKRLDITIDRSSPQSNTPDDDTHIDLSEFVTRPQRRLPFAPGDVGYHNDDPNVKMIEINQCLSYGFDTATGDLYVMENFVAGKETAVFISFNEPFDPRSEAILTIERDGEVITQLQPAGAPDAYTLLFHPRDMAEVGHWEAGSYRLTFETDSGRAVRTVNFFESTYLKILAVPVRANYSGRVVSCDGEWRNGASMIIAAFPVARANVEYVLAPELDLSDRKYDLNTQEGMFYVWEALTNLQTKSDDYTLIVGYVRDAVLGGGVLGYTFGPPTTIVVESEPDMLATVPHEVAHCYMIGDEYDGGHFNLDLNPPPYGMSGRDIITNRPVSATNRNVVGGENAGVRGTGSVIYEEQRPYWVEGSTLLGAVTSYMGGGTRADSFTMWTSSDIWNHIYKVYVGHTADEFTGGFVYEPEYWGQCPHCFGDVFDPGFYVECWQCYEFTQVTGYEFECAGCSAQWSIDDYYDDLYMECSACRYFIWYSWFEDFNTGPVLSENVLQQGRFTQITGYVDTTGAFTPSPWYTFETSQNVVTPSEFGEYGVYVYDTAGAFLSVTYFNVNAYAKIVTAEGSSSVPLDRSPVNVSVRFPANAARIDIQKGDSVIYSRYVSQNEPTVAFTGLSENQQLSDNVTLTWDASDADGDELFFDVWYYPSEGECYNIAANITGRSFAADLSEFPGSGSGYFHIYATDGVWTSEDSSPRVRVPYKAPTILTEIKGIPEYKLTEEIDLDVDVYDAQDGWLWADGSVIWMYEGDVYLSSSGLWVWPFELQPGLHTFTCVATNSMGLTAEKSYTFRILDDDSDLPDDWSRDDIVSALSGGFVLPLDRLDAPVTRGQFAEIMTVMYIYMLEEDFDTGDFEAFLEGIDISDCGDDAGPYFMLYLGVMEALNGRFEPARSLTELEAALIMYRVSALADPVYFDLSYTDENIVQAFYNLEVFDRSGPNVLNEAERLTVRLALVRCSRFFEAVYG